MYWMIIGNGLTQIIIKCKLIQVLCVILNKLNQSIAHLKYKKFLLKISIKIISFII